MSMKKSMPSKLSVAALSVLMALTGCAANQPLRERATVKEAINRSADVWPEPAVEREGEMSMVLLTPMAIPTKLANKRIKLSLQPGTTIRDVVAVLAMEGVHIIVADSTAADKEFYLPRFEGTVGDLTRVLSRSADVFFTWKDNMIVVSSSERFAVAVPQETKLGDKLKDGITSLGGKAMAHPEAGLLVFECSPKVLDQIKLYVDRLTRNSALVTLEVSILSVTLSDESKRGVDWDKLVLAVGQGTAAAVASAGSSTGSTVSATAGSTSVSTTIPDSLVQLGSGSLKAGLFSSRVSMSVLLNLLDTYGTTDTLQNVKTKTLTGYEAELSNNTQIPYIQSVGVTPLTSGVVQPTVATTTTGTTVNTTNGTTATTGTLPATSVQSTGTLMGSSQAATANDGVTLKLKPTYDRDANTVTIELNLAVNSVLGFNNLSAGNQIGTLSQPTTASRKLTDILRLRPGQTAIIGGVIYENTSDNRSTIMRQQAVESNNVTKKRNEMFIVVRPTVSQFGKVTTQEAARTGQDYMPESEDLLPSMAEPIADTAKPKKLKATKGSGAGAPLPQAIVPGMGMGAPFTTPGGVPVNLPAFPSLPAPKGGANGGR